MKRIRTQAERYFIYHGVRLFRLRSASEKVARGFALGLIVNFFPTFGLGVLISGFFARLLGGNVIAGFVGGATLTCFWPFLFFLNMRVGGLVLNDFRIQDPGQVTAGAISAMVWGSTFLVGALVNSLLVGTSVYLLFLLFFQRYRERGLVAFQRMMTLHQCRA